MALITKKNNEFLKYRKLYFFFLIALSSVIHIQTIKAQTKEFWVLEFGGRVLDDVNGQEMEDVLIVLLKDKTEINKVRTTASGAFLFKVPQEGEFSLVFSKNGYTSKILSISKSI